MNAEGQKWLRSEHAPKLLYLDDQRFQLDGVAAYFHRRFELEIEVAQTIEEALHKVAACRPDIVLVDLHLNDNTTGFQLLEALRKPHPKVIIVSSWCTEYSVYYALRHHVAGFVDKSDGMDALVFAVAQVLNNRTSYCRRALDIQAAMARDPHAIGKLTSMRNRRFLEAVSLDLTDAEIAVKLNMKSTSVGQVRRRWAGRFNVRPSQLVRKLRLLGFNLAQKLRL